MILDRVVVGFGKVLPKGVCGTVAMCSTDVERQFLVLGPSLPAPLIATCRANQHPSISKRMLSASISAANVAASDGLGKGGVHGVRVSVVDDEPADRTPVRGSSH